MAGPRESHHLDLLKVLPEEFRLGRGHDVVLISLNDKCSGLDPGQLGSQIGVEQIVQSGARSAPLARGRRFCHNSF